jgi:Fe-S-cluster containining protein
LNVDPRTQNLEIVTLDQEPMKSLENYFRLIDKVDELSRRIEDRFRDSISCVRGCDACCRHLTLFPVEGAALALALKELDPDSADHIRSRARGALPDGPCPLLKDGACLLYRARPLICRTHGLPLLTASEGKKRIDFCPENFRGLDSLPGDAVIDLDLLNSALAAINSLFVREAFPQAPIELRISIAESLLWKDG